MRVTYSYPHLDRIDLRGRGIRYEISRRLGSSQIPEYSSEEVPVAAVFELGYSGIEQQIRVRDGILYTKHEGSIQDVINNDIDTPMLSFFADHLIDSKKSHLKVVQENGFDAKYPLWLSWRKQRTCFLQRNHMFIRNGIDVAALEPMTPKDSDCFVDEVWALKANEIVGSKLLIDGVLWSPTPEPVARIRYGHDDTFIELDDLSAFTNYREAKQVTPYPFGKKDMNFSDVRYIRSNLHPYWNPEWHFISWRRLEALHLSSGRLRFDAHMPELFQADISEQIVDRAARLAVVYSSNEFFEYPSEQGQMTQRQKAIATLQKMTKSEPTEIDHDRAIDLLELVKLTIPASSWYRRDMRLSHSISLSMRVDIDNAKSQWDDRIVQMPMQSHRKLRP